MTNATATELETTLLTAVDRWNAGDLDGYLTLYDEGILLHGYSPEPRTSPRSGRSTRAPSPRSPAAS